MLTRKMATNKGISFNTNNYLVFLEIMGILGKVLSIEVY
jgi:hypothetical protein